MRRIVKIVETRSLAGVGLCLALTTIPVVSNQVQGDVMVSLLSSFKQSTDWIVNSLSVESQRLPFVICCQVIESIYYFPIMQCGFSTKERSLSTRTERSCPGNRPQLQRPVSPWTISNSHTQELHLALPPLLNTRCATSSVWK
jgi:hypothetical protein